MNQHRRARVPLTIRSEGGFIGTLPFHGHRRAGPNANGASPPARKPAKRTTLAQGGCRRCVYCSGISVGICGDKQSALRARPFARDDRQARPFAASVSPPTRLLPKARRSKRNGAPGSALSTYRPGSPQGELSCGGMLVRLDSAAHATDFQAKGAIAGRHSRNHREV